VKSVTAEPTLSAIKRSRLNIAPCIPTERGLDFYVIFELEVRECFSSENILKALMSR
jgi:hypothetical protein